MLPFLQLNSVSLPIHPFFSTNLRPWQSPCTLHPARVLAAQTQLPATCNYPWPIMSQEKWHVRCRTFCLPIKASWPVAIKTIKSDWRIMTHLLPAFNEGSALLSPCKTRLPSSCCPTLSPKGHGKIQRWTSGRPMLFEIVWICLDTFYAIFMQGRT